MLLGVGRENQGTFEAAVQDTISFLEQLSVYYSNQIQLLKDQAQAESRYVSAYVDMIAQANIEHSIKRLKQFVSSDDSKMLSKCFEYLFRTQEFLTLIAQNSSDGAFFIPVPFHQKIAKEHQEQLLSCQSLINRCLKLLQNQTIEQQKKSWFPLSIHYANILPDIRAISFGLSTPGKQEQALNRLTKVLQKLNELEREKTTITKTTTNELGISDFKQEPSKPSAYHQYVPPLAPLMRNFKNLMTEQEKNRSVLTRQSLHEAVKTSFPRPSLKS